MPNDTKGENESRKSHAGCALLGMLILAIVYILSPVPLMILLEHGPISFDDRIGSIILTFLAPLEWCYNNIEFVEAFYDYLFELTGR